MFRFLLTLLAVFTVVSPALAQNTMFMHRSPIAHLNDAERAQLRVTMLKILESPDGTVMDWSSENTDARGRIKALDTHQAFDTTCRTVRMRNIARGRQNDGIYRLCQDPDARDGWRFAPMDGHTPGSS